MVKFCPEAEALPAVEVAIMITILISAVLVKFCPEAVVLPAVEIATRIIRLANVVQETSLNPGVKKAFR